MEHTIWLLQLFAEGISGAEGAAVAGQQDTGETPARAEETQDAAATNRLTWEQIMQDPEYNRQMQTVIRARLKAAQQAWEKKNKEEKAASVKAGSTAQAVPAGLHSPVSAPYTAKKSYPWQQERHLQQHFAALQRQGAQMQKAFPDFSLEQALSDPQFVRLTAPHVGLSVENAYYLLNRQKLQGAAMQLAAKRTAEKLSNAIVSGTYRPRENGTAARAPSVATFNYATASRQSRQALKDAIRQAGIRGEKLYPDRM